MTTDAESNSTRSPGIPALIEAARTWLGANGGGQDHPDIYAELQRLTKLQRERDLFNASVTWLRGLEVWIYAKPKPKPYRYGLTPKRQKQLTTWRHQYPAYAREIHVLSVVITAPYTVQRDLADACTADSELSARTWARVIQQMIAHGVIKLGAAGYEPSGDFTDIDRPQESKTATRNVAGKIHREPAKRDPSAKAQRVRNVIRYCYRTADYKTLGSVDALARQCAKNGSGKFEGYRDVIQRMLGSVRPELRRDNAWGQIEIIPDSEL
jgi:hypothetical protein